MSDSVSEKQSPDSAEALAAYAGELRAARTAGAFYPAPSERFEPFDLTIAYRIQNAYVGALRDGEQIGGFKAAGTGAPVQQALGLHGPIFGVLFASGQHHPAQPVERSGFRMPLLETEVAYRLSTTVREPLASVDALRERVATCLATIELADPGLRGRFGGADMVACNTASAGWIEGTPHSVGAVDPETVNVAFSRDGDALHSGAASALQGGQWQSLLWLVNETIAQGYTIEPHHLLLNGALGPAQPAKPGHYLADYGTFGQIEFHVN